MHTFVLLTKHFPQVFIPIISVHIDDSARASASAAAAAYTARKNGPPTGRLGPHGGRPPLPDHPRQRPALGRGSAGEGGGGEPSSRPAVAGCGSDGSDGGTKSDDQVLLCWAALKEVFIKSREGVMAGDFSRGGECRCPAAKSSVYALIVIPNMLV